MKASAELFAVMLLSSIILIYAGYILMQWNKAQSTMLHVDEWLQERTSLSATFVQCMGANITVDLNDKSVNLSSNLLCYVYNSPDLEEYYANGRDVLLLLLDQYGDVVGTAFLKGVYDDNVGAIAVSVPKADDYGRLIMFSDETPNTNSLQVMLVFYKGDMELPLNCLITGTSSSQIEVGTCSG